MKYLVKKVDIMGERHYVLFMIGHEFKFEMQNVFSSPKFALRIRIRYKTFFYSYQK